MVDVTVLSQVTNVTAGDQTAAVSVSSSQVSVSAGTTGVIEIQNFTRTRYLGSAFSGSNGASSRALTHTESIGSNAIISLGQRFLDTSEYSLSTSTATDDTITLSIPLFNDDVVSIWV